MLNIRILKNSLRICKRLIALSNHLDALQEARSKWVTWNRWALWIRIAFLFGDKFCSWLSYLGSRRLLVSKRLPEQMSRKYALYRSFPDLLVENNVSEDADMRATIKVTAHRTCVTWIVCQRAWCLQPLITDLVGVFARWKFYIQERVVFHKLHAISEQAAR